ncbi:hypothetical protein HDU76_008228, partial [Blyttiomyces sp. JEL0837]
RIGYEINNGLTHLHIISTENAIITTLLDDDDEHGDNLVFNDLKSITLGDGWSENLEMDIIAEILENYGETLNHIYICKGTGTTWVDIVKMLGNLNLGLGGNCENLERLTIYSTRKRLTPFYTREGFYMGSPRESTMVEEDNLTRALMEEMVMYLPESVRVVRLNCGACGEEEWRDVVDGAGIRVITGGVYIDEPFAMCEYPQFY